jgi:hypothetical protein
MALADEADDDGYCFPSPRRLAAKCSITDRTVRRVLLELTTKGYVTLEMRRERTAHAPATAIDLLVATPRTKCPGVRTRCPRAPDNGVRGCGQAMSYRYPPHTR